MVLAYNIIDFMRTRQRTISTTEKDHRKTLTNFEETVVIFRVSSYKKLQVRSLTTSQSGHLPR